MSDESGSNVVRKVRGSRGFEYVLSFRKPKAPGGESSGGLRLGAHAPRAGLEKSASTFSPETSGRREMRGGRVGSMGAGA